ncbi:hypothetical protein DFH28DRAFT_859675, partial [Melampsora americana]
RYNDPILPVEDYCRTVEIIHDHYKIIVGGHGSLCDQHSKEAIFTFNHEDIKTQDTKPGSHFNNDQQELQGAIFRIYDNKEKFFTIPVNQNGAMLGGTLGVFGYRASYDDMIVMGGYVTKPSITKEEYNDVISELIPLENYLGTHFRQLAPNAFATSQEILNLHQAPSTSTQPIETGQCAANYFSGDLAFTYKNFHNKAHVDNDKSEHTYCIWVAISSRNGQIVTEAEGFHVEGGYFVVPEYQIALSKPGNGLLEMVWS